MADATRIRLGVLTRPHGLKGGLRCTLDYPETPAITLPCTVAIGFSESFNSPYELIAYEPGRGEIVCHFRGFDDRDRAMELADKALFVPRAALSYGTAVADPGLVGFRVLDEQGNLLGTVAGIFQTPAHYIWTVEDAESGEEWMVPAIDEFVVDIDEENERITLRLIPGLRGEDQEKTDGDR